MSDHDDDDEKDGSCDDCSTGGTCEGDHGAYEEVTEQSYHSDSTDCDHHYSTTPEHLLSVDPDIVQDEEPDVIDTDFKYFFLTSYFENPPDGLIDYENCNYDSLDRPKPGAVEYEIKHPEGSNHDRSDFAFEKPSPTEEEENATEDLILAVVNSVAASSGNPYVMFGAAATTAFVNSDAWGSPVDFNKDDNYGTTQQQRWTWKISLDGNTKSDFRQDRCDSTAARFRINPNYAGQTGEATAACRYGYYLPRYPDTYCRCSEPSHTSFFSDWAVKNFAFDVPSDADT